jgi:DNA-binding CsgD family transcriptional regulator
MASRPLAEILVELRRCVPGHHRPHTERDCIALLSRLLPHCLPLAVDERPGSITFKLQIATDPRTRLTCVLHHTERTPLTAAEAAVAEELCEGRTLAQIARLRGVSVNTIKSQVRQLFRKLEVDSRVALVRRIAP